MDQHLEQAIARLGDLLPAVGDTCDPLTADDVRAIEKRIGRSLDPIHRDLLTRFGASGFEEGGVYFKPEKPLPKSYSKNNTGYVSTILGRVNEKFPKATGISILHKLDILDGDLPTDFLPVAAVGSGDLYGVKGDGSVWLWIHDARKGKELHYVAASFASWLSRLHK